MKYDFAMENCLGTDYPNLHELNKNCYGFSPASVQNGPQAAAAAAAADEQTMYKVIITITYIGIKMYRYVYTPRFVVVYCVCTFEFLCSVSPIFDFFFCSTDN